MNSLTSRLLPLGVITLVLAACGGAQDQQASPLPTTAMSHPSATVNTGATDTVSQLDAVRLMYQGAFGPSAALLTDIQSQSAADWVHAQMDPNLPRSRYTSGGYPSDGYAADVVHKPSKSTKWCTHAPATGVMLQEFCSREYYRADPLTRDFYANAVHMPDQLRQRVALALGQIVVVSGREIDGTYGLRIYQNRLLDLAFTNWRDVLRAAALSPVMGDYLDHVNNDPVAPNENFGRELLQLFSLGPCLLNNDGTLKQGTCKATYGSDHVAAYSRALTGWTYPAGGTADWNCTANCRYYGNEASLNETDREMAAYPALHNSSALTLLSGYTLQAGHTPQQALNTVLDSLMAHPNMAPFVARQLISHLVSNNPSSGYVVDVVNAFNSGTYQSGGYTFGSGNKGDLAATVASILLHPEARTTAPASSAGHLIEPVLHITTVLRAFNAQTDGGDLDHTWGSDMLQPIFQSPSVFNFYPPDFPLPNTNLVAPTFGIHTPATQFRRLNYVLRLLDNGGIKYPPGASDPCAVAKPGPSCIPGGTGTVIDLAGGPFGPLADNPSALVSAVSQLLIGRELAAPQHTAVVDAVAAWTASWDPVRYRARRIMTAGYLIANSPDAQVLP